VYDVCDALRDLAHDADTLVDEIERLFASENLPYRMTLEGIEWRFSEAADICVTKTRQLLSSSRYAGPSEQWDKARAHLSKKPPDAENRIKDAVGALEGVARILSDTSKQTLGQLIGPLATQLGIPAPLKDAISKLYGYRGDEDGVGHGAAGPLGDNSAEAELVLHWSAAAITYLHRKAESGAAQLS
jgi:hypothetical protein